MRIAVSDESGTQGGNRCYGIGAFVVQAEKYEELDRLVRGILDKHGVTHELKWSFTASRRCIEAACEAVEALLRRGARFYAIVVDKTRFVNLRYKGKEEGFYQTYQFLAEHVAKWGQDSFELWMDERSDGYEKRPEVVRIITNYRTRMRQGTADLLDVKMIDSQTNAILQMTDLLVGAIVADRQKLLAGNKPLRDGKEEMILRFSGLLNWDRLYYDTLPNRYFNIWHFPQETRGPTRKLPRWLKLAA